ncbi:MAG: argininosuccinate lyase, partial [Luteibaculum sp.]
MKLWDKGYNIDNFVSKYTVGKDRELDMYLAKYDVQASKAHAQILASIDLLSVEELAALEAALDLIAQEIERGIFEIEDQFEDVHSKLEALLTEKVGEAGKKIHSARSRNDQVLVALHLFCKSELKELLGLISNLFETLLSLADQHKSVLMPGYTHLQVAMPSSFGLWFSAFAETLIDDVIQLRASYQIADQNPLGSAAGYGSSFPIDRDYTTKALDFAWMKYNAIACQYNRGRLEKSMAFTLSSVAGTLNKMASDMCLFVNQNFGFVSFPKELCTGSSIMPHKQNPDVWELMRAHCNKAQQLPVEVAMLTTNLATGYHRDFQLLKEIILPAVFQMKENLVAADFMLQHIQVNTNILENQELYQYMFSVESINAMVLNGESFRDAYKKLGEEIASGTFKAKHQIN